MVAERGVTAVAGFVVAPDVAGSRRAASDAVRNTSRDAVLLPAKRGAGDALLPSRARPACRRSFGARKRAHLRARGRLPRPQFSISPAPPRFYKATPKFPVRLALPPPQANCKRTDSCRAPPC